MKQFKVHCIDGTILETAKPIKSFTIKEQFTFFYSEDGQKGYGIAVVANSQIKCILWEGED